MQILYVTTVGSTMSFFTNLIRSLIDEGNTVNIACNEKLKPIPPCFREWGCQVYPIACTRSPFSKSNITAIKQIRKIVSEGKYDIVHCHTPVAGFCARIACRKIRKKGVRVFYTAHGFHFYKGAPLLNWLFYYPAEKLCARMTDIIITINKEDYLLAKRKMRACHVKYVPGAGVDIDRFRTAEVSRDQMRGELGIPRESFLLISVGELNSNKNHQIVIHALAKLKNPRVHYLIVGIGPKETELKTLAVSLGVSDQVHFVGYRDDVEKLYKIADINVFPSIREGLGIASIEGMASGLPLVCADNRGTREYATVYRVNGFENMCTTVDDYATAISRLESDDALYKKLCEIGYPSVQKFSSSIVIQRMKELYETDDKV